MIPAPADCASFALAAVSGVGLLQCAAGWAALQHFHHRRAAEPTVLPPITVLKPLHGDEPMLEAALASICGQDYPNLQVVFGLQDAQDPALEVLQRLRTRFPGLQMDVVVDRTDHGVNRKIGNLINMLGAAQHEFLVIADSDMHVAPDYLRRVVAAMRPGVGLVTTVYAGLPATATLPGRMGAAQINHAFLPGALLARALGRQDCLGATMALTRTTLEQVGGLRALANELADDAVLGRLVRAQGLEVALADSVPGTTVPEVQMAALVQHELRWARTVKSLEPTGFAMSAVQYPLFWAALAVAFSGMEGWTLGLFGMGWVVRAVIARGIDRHLGVASSLTIWCLPLRDMLSMAVILASYRTRRVAWRGRILRATRPSLAPGKG